MDWIVRPVTRSDAQGVIDILNPIIEAGRYTVLDISYTLEEEVAFILNFPKKGLFNVAVHPETELLLGFQVIEPFASYTHAFDHVGVIGTFVAAGYKRQGIASALFSSSFDDAKTLGYENCLLMSEWIMKELWRLI